MKVNNFMIYFVVVKHLIWGGLILVTPFALNTSTLAVLNNFFPDYHIGGMLLILSSLAALYGLLIFQNSYKIIFFLLPLLCFVWLFGLTALNAVLQGHYADGVIRPWEFILADQLSAILLIVFVTIIVFEPLWHKKTYE